MLRALLGQFGEGAQGGQHRFFRVGDAGQRGSGLVEVLRGSSSQRAHVVDEGGGQQARVAFQAFGVEARSADAREFGDFRRDFDHLADVHAGLGAPGKKDGFCWLKSGRKSTLVRRFNAGDELGACLAMLSWVKAGGQYSRGLFNRRWQEYQLCIEGAAQWNTGGRR